MTDNVKIIDKIRKLLALTRSPNEHEAALATERAQELLARYNIDMTEVEQKLDEGKIGQVEVMERTEAFARTIRQAIARLYFCEYYYYTQRHESPVNPGKWVRFDHHFYVGESHNVEVAKMMSDYLVATIIRLARKGALDYPRIERKTYRGSFRVACSRRLAMRIAERILESRNKEMVMSDGRNLPALANLYDVRSDQNKSWIAENVGEMRTKKSRAKESNIHGSMDGMAAADSISLDQQVGSNGSKGIS